MLNKMVSDIRNGNDLTVQGQSASQSNIPDYQNAMKFFVENKGQFDRSVKFIAVTEFGKALFYDFIRAI
jgi:hypothetical protein